MLLLTTGVSVVGGGGTFPPVPGANYLTEAEVTALAAMYWPASEVPHAVAVSKCESGGWNANAWNQRGEDSRGLWQINVGPGAHPQLAVYNLFDPQVNAYWANQIWRASGWGPWTCAHLLGIV